MQSTFFGQTDSERIQKKKKNANFYAWMTAFPVLHLRTLAHAFSPQKKNSNIIENKVNSKDRL